MKKQSNLSRLMGYAGSFPGLFTGGECHTLRLVCRIVCGYIYCRLYTKNCI